MSKKAARYLKESQKGFYKIITEIGDRKPRWQVWSDFIECSAIAISNCCDHESEARKLREEKYLKIINGYTKQDQENLAKLLACVTNALEDEPNQDFLGEMYQALELNSHWHGQFFTPYHISHFMAKVTISADDPTLRERGWIGFNDPACGAGSLLIAARNVCAEEGIGFRQMLFTAQDVDHVVALMCYIQLSLLGCAGYVVVGDSLLSPVGSMGSPLLPVFQSNHDVWFTPMFYDEVWQDRIRWAMLGLLLRDAGAESAKEESEPAPAPMESAKDAVDESDTVIQEVVAYDAELVAEQTGQLRIF